jgi:phospholipase C
VNNPANVKSIVVLMMENRSLDNFAGWIYSNNGNVSPNGDTYDGLTTSMYNPAPVTGTKVYAGATTVHKNPVLDPGEGFANTVTQLFGGNPPPNTQGMGYLTDFTTVVNGKLDPNVIMQGFDPSIVSCTQRIAQQAAICDEWFCSVPSETWPNRSFVHAATSNGNIDNWPYDPDLWNVPTIFNVMARRPGSTWRVYYDDFLIPLTWLQMRQLHPFGYWKNFRGLDDFYADAASGSLPQYAFLEPSFFPSPVTGPETDAHPPHNVFIGDQFIGKIYNAIIASPQFQANELLFIITFDEHGGCYDHVAPFDNATPPPQTNAQFDFTRFGVRVPTIVVSPYVVAGSVFNMRPTGPLPAPGSTLPPWSTYTPYDHTSILRTIEVCFDYEPLSTRDAVAPDLGGILTGPARTNYEPVPIAAPPAEEAQPPAKQPMNDLQLSIIGGLAHMAAPDVLHVLDAVPKLVKPLESELAKLPSTVEDAIDYIRGKKQEMGLM